MMLFRVACHGGGDEPLNAHLKRITDSAYTRKTLGGAEIDGELLAPIIQESHDGDCRCEIMRHLRECLSEPSGKRWQRIYGGLALAEILMQHGSPALAIEVAHGHHFDLVQRVSFLEQFDATARGCADRRAQKALREKARAFLDVLVPQLEKASDEEPPGTSMILGLTDKATPSTCSKDAPSMSPGSTGSTTASGSETSTTSSSTSPACSSPEKESYSTGAHIDNAFSTLREWMDSSDTSSGCPSSVSPRMSPSEASHDDSDSEAIGRLPPRLLADSWRQSSPWSDKSDRSDASDVFFTPMPTPASAVFSSERPKLLMSL